MKKKSIILLLLMSLVAAQAWCAESLSIKPGDTLQKVLEGYKGKRVTIRLQAGEELTGKVKGITKELLHLEELTRREYFDAVVDLGKIDAVIVRAKE